MALICELCGKTFDYNELNTQDNLILDNQGRWKKETTYRCFDCSKEAVLGK